MVRALVSDWLASKRIDPAARWSSRPRPVTRSFAGICKPNYSPSARGARIDRCYDRSSGGSRVAALHPRYGFCGCCALHFRHHAEHRSVRLAWTGYQIIDTSAKRTVNNYRGVNLLLDAPIYSLTNKVLSGISSANRDSSNFGGISGRSSNSRYIELAGRISFSVLNPLMSTPSKLVRRRS